MGICRSVVAWFSKIRPVLLTHFNLLLMMSSGAGVATTMRLNWDPTTFLPLRSLYPDVHAISVVFLPIASTVLSCLAHLILFTLCLRRPDLKRRLLYWYGALMSCLALAELIYAIIVICRISNTRKDSFIVNMALSAKDMLKKILSFVSNIFNTRSELLETIEEFERKVQKNFSAAIAWGVGLGILQVAAILLSILEARAQPHLATRTDIERGTRTPIDNRKTSNYSTKPLGYSVNNVPTICKQFENKYRENNASSSINFTTRKY